MATCKHATASAANPVHFCIEVYFAETLNWGLPFCSIRLEASFPHLMLFSSCKYCKLNLAVSAPEIFLPSWIHLFLANQIAHMAQKKDRQISVLIAFSKDMVSVLYTLLTSRAYCIIKSCFGSTSFSGQRVKDVTPDVSASTVFTTYSAV
ncbi:hypothetical protein F383_13959 [Gossypium arboreum]|uniref:Uncharacterized protein n=1 Tax=Gossypium arboreum TaxID=29729 RepID=A0A0B0NBZ4_GOSAR|nr:hypothetical protein F383_13959 [Gossypium arboreum]